jgi:hypothetical protein
MNPLDCTVGVQLINGHVLVFRQPTPQEHAALRAWNVRRERATKEKDDTALDRVAHEECQELIAPLLLRVEDAEGTEVDGGAAYVREHTCYLMGTTGIMVALDLTFRDFRAPVADGAA